MSLCMNPFATADCVRATVKSAPKKGINHSGINHDLAFANKTLKKLSRETFLKVLAPENVTKGGARAQARAPPLWLHLKAKTHKNVSGEGFLRVLGGRGRVF